MEAAASNPLGVAVFVIGLVGLCALWFFSSASTRVKLGVFAAYLICSFLLVLILHASSLPEFVSPDPPELPEPPERPRLSADCGTPSGSCQVGMYPVGTACSCTYYPSFGYGFPFTEVGARR